MRRWKTLVIVAIVAVAAITYFAANQRAADLAASERAATARLAATGSLIVRESCEQTNRVSLVTRAALIQQKKLSTQKYERGDTPEREFLGQQVALNKAIDGLAPRDCERAASALRLSVR